MPAHDSHWNYSDDSGQGPSEWAKFYPTGKLQSPINILVDYRDLHQSACNNCAPDKQAKRLEQSLQLGGEPDNERPPPASTGRRPHLDSLGNDTESDDRTLCDSPDESNRSPAAPRLANDCLTIWRSKKLASPIQARKAHLQQQQQHDSEQQQRQQKQQQQQQNTRYCVTNKKIFLGYPRFLNTISVCNTGHSWQVDMPRELAQHTRKCFRVPR